MEIKKKFGDIDSSEESSSDYLDEEMIMNDPKEIKEFLVAY